MIQYKNERRTNTADKLLILWVACGGVRLKKKLLRNSSKILWDFFYSANKKYITNTTSRPRVMLYLGGKNRRTVCDKKPHPPCKRTQGTAHFPRSEGPEFEPRTGPLIW